MRSFSRCAPLVFLLLYYTILWVICQGFFATFFYFFLTAWSVVVCSPCRSLILSTYLLYHRPHGKSMYKLHKVSGDLWWYCLLTNWLKNGIMEGWYEIRSLGSWFTNRPSSAEIRKEGDKVPLLLPLKKLLH